MAGIKERELHCSVVNEPVRIKLSTRRDGGFSGTDVPFVQCNQHECQYVDENLPPCPLHPDMFADEIADRERQRLEDY